MKVKEILAEWLENHGYDGLYDHHKECCCSIDDLMPCEDCPDQCVADHQEQEGDGNIEEMEE